MIISFLDLLSLFMEFLAISVWVDGVFSMDLYSPLLNSRVGGRAKWILVDWAGASATKGIWG
jgi:hypothetical protein